MTWLSPSSVAIEIMYSPPVDTNDGWPPLFAVRNPCVVSACGTLLSPEPWNTAASPPPAGGWIVTVWVSAAFENAWTKTVEPSGKVSLTSVAIPSNYGFF